jgi:fibronectin type 3 domain-containing protein
VIYTDTSKVLSGERSYLYAAKAVNNSSVESAFSDTITIHPNIKTVPPSPNRLSVYEEDGAVNLVWEDVKARHRAVQGYNVYRRDLPGGKFELLLPKDSIVPVPVFADKSAQPGKSYEYAVQTVDDWGGVSESMALGSISIKPLQLPVPPNAWLTQNAGKVTVQWAETLKDTLLKVNLYRYQRGSKPQLLRTFLPNERKYEDVKVKKGELYFYYTTFTDDKKNESGKSQEISIRVE